MQVLRLCSVFEPDPAALTGRGSGFDPIGGLQNHAGALTRALDRLGVTQTVITSRLGGHRGEVLLGDHASVRWVGAPIRRFRQLWAADAFRRLRSGHGPFDLVHAHQGEDLALLPLAIAAARRFEAPLVVTMHCSLRHTLAPVSARTRALRAVGAPLEARSLRAADRIITLTRRAAGLLADDGVDPERITVIPSGFEPALFDGTADGADEMPWDGLGRPRVGYVGRFAPQKDVVGLICAFEHVEAPGASLVLVGDGPDRRRVDAAVAASPRSARIRCTGFVAHHRVPSILAELDVMVLASRYEELGSVLVEGLRAGVPIVATAVGGIPEVIRHAETGLLVPPDDPVALAAAIDLVLDDAALAGRLSTNARIAAAAYRWDDLADAVVSVYQAAGTSAPVRR